jgi:hypothetical protein
MSKYLGIEFLGNSIRACEQLLYITLFWDGVSLCCLAALKLLGSSDSPASASWVARTTEVYYWAWFLLTLFFKPFKWFWWSARFGDFLWWWNDRPWCLTLDSLGGYFTAGVKDMSFPWGNSSCLLSPQPRSVPFLSCLPAPYQRRAFPAKDPMNLLGCHPNRYGH